MADHIPGKLHQMNQYQQPVLPCMRPSARPLETVLVIQSSSLTDGILKQNLAGQEEYFLKAEVSIHHIKYIQ